jgi:hypothetical protein
MKKFESLSNSKFNALGKDQMGEVKGGSWRYVAGSGTCDGGNTSFLVEHFNIWGNSTGEYRTETDRTSFN